MAAGLDTRDAIRRIVERSDIDEFAELILDSFWDRPEYRPFRPPRHEVRGWVRWNVDLVIRWVVDGQAPGEEEVARFRERAGAHAAAGMPPDIVPANFRTGARAAWTALLDAARDDERPALLESAGLLFDFVDRVTQVFSDTYDAAAPLAAASSEDLRAQGLLERICAGEELTVDDHRFAERIRFPLGEATYRPFAVFDPGLAVGELSRLAAGLRAGDVLAVPEGRMVVGLSTRPADLGGAVGRSDLVVVADQPCLAARLRDAIDDLRSVAQVAARSGASGGVAVDDHVGELLLLRSPRLAGRLHARVYGRLAEGDPELARTLDCLIAHDFDRGAAAAALPVHRNTLNNRLRRIRSLTGLDVDSAKGRSLVWLAWLEAAGRGARGGS